MARWQGCLTAIVAAWLSAGLAQAVSFSFAGTFTQDDDHVNFTFSSPGGLVTIRTWGYAGGTNAANTLIPAGGFDPVLSLFDSTGGLTAVSQLVTFTDTTGCGLVAVDPATGACFDEELDLNALDPTHTYTLVLTQSNNYPVSSFYGDGFTQDGTGNFTPGEFGCPANAFCDSNLPSSVRTGNWAVDITGVGTATGAVPEPGSLWLLTGAMGALWFTRRQRQRKERP